MQDAGELIETAVGELLGRFEQQAGPALAELRTAYEGWNRPARWALVRER